MRHDAVKMTLTQLARRLSDVCVKDMGPRVKLRCRVPDQFKKNKALGACFVEVSKSS